MKNTFSLAAAVGLLLALGSCKKDEVQVKADVGAAPVLTANATDAGILISANATKTALVYTWSPVTFALSDGSKPVIATSYTLEFAKTGTNFANFSSVSAGSNIVRDSLKVGDLNTALIKAGLTPTVAGTVDVRLRANYAGNQSDLVSNSTKLTAVPYSRELYFFGGSFGALSSSSVYVQEQDGKPGQYDGYVWMPNATNTFKLADTNTGAGTSFGSATSAAVTTPATASDPVAVTNGTGGFTAGAGDITLPGPKYYQFTVNKGTSTFKAMSTEWGLIGPATTGDATGWNQSQQMTYDPAKKVWTLTMVLPGAGSQKFKFRPNQQWNPINLGDYGTTEATKNSLQYFGSDMNSPGAGTYKITLDLSVPNKYTYSFTK